MNRRQFMRLCGMGVAGSAMGVAVGGVATTAVADHFTRLDLKLAFATLCGYPLEVALIDEEIPEGFNKESFLKAVCRNTGKPTQGWVGDRALAAWERSQA